MKNHIERPEIRRLHWTARRLPHILAAVALQLAGASYAHAGFYTVYTSSTRPAMEIANNSPPYCSLAEAVASANAGHQMYDCVDGNPSPGAGTTIWLVEASGKPFASNPFVVTSLTINSVNTWVVIRNGSISTTGLSGFIIRAGSGLYLDGANLTYTGGSTGGRLIENYGTFESNNVTLANGNVTTHTNGTGGAIFNAGVIDSMYYTTIRNNRAKKGGGIYNAGGQIGNLMGVSITNNDATAGGGIYNANSATALGAISYVLGLSISSNHAVTGGGVFNKGTVFFENTTITNNSASGVNSGERDKYNNTCDGMGGGLESMDVNTSNIGVSYAEVYGGAISGNSASSIYRGGAVGGDRVPELTNGVSISNNGTAPCRIARDRNNNYTSGVCPPVL